MTELPVRRAASKERHAFGFGVMGPILAECCHVLSIHLDAVSHDGASRVLYCARGGLIIRRALDEFGERIQRPRLDGADLMVSRLAASRLGLQACPQGVAPLFALEFDGRSCAAVASVLSGKTLPDRGDWALPYTLERLLRLFSADAHGREAHDAIASQAALLREHIASQCGSASTLYVIDTGVFGSIGHFLALGLPDRTVNAVLLFRANYKRRAGLSLPAAAGLVCDENDYSPWKPRSVSRLYWPFIEAFFEPELPSVRTFGRAADGEVTSNLQQANWQSRLSPQCDAMRAGAFDYLATLNPASVPSIEAHATRAWRALRKRIVYPTRDDLVLLGVTRRGVDFGFEDVVNFGDAISSTKAACPFARARESIWPEGEIRRLFPITAGAWLHMYEAGRFAAAAGRAMFRPE
ncbi:MULTISPECIES: hypothetical protein [unclassified Caballeronia]|uniref:hypothetical protein n=1 Tax=unclassified Caballeronia TaxID=2646786 RepID=UPI00285F6C85|nr:MULTISPECIES: hypothetical protein [unclassified Caballeronia]MDR5752561.1 hypothetical protein [Caballeronia sp. LZ024]MDR5841717.1 hypothetical protein [Caballeronia sp. LZ031]